MFLESKIAPFDFLIKVTKKQKERQPKSTLRKTQTPIVAKQTQEHTLFTHNNSCGICVFTKFTKIIMRQKGYS